MLGVLVVVLALLLGRRCGRRPRQPEVNIVVAFTNPEYGVLPPVRRRSSASRPRLSAAFPSQRVPSVQHLRHAAPPSPDKKVPPGAEAVVPDWKLPPGDGDQHPGVYYPPGEMKKNPLPDSDHLQPNLPFPVEFLPDKPTHHDFSAPDPDPDLESELQGEELLGAVGGAPPAADNPPPPLDNPPPYTEHDLKPAEPAEPAGPVVEPSHPPDTEHKYLAESAEVQNELNTYLEPTASPPAPPPYTPAHTHPGDISPTKDSHDTLF